MVDAAEIERAAERLAAGGLVAFPTETVYGLGADATNVRAVARVFEVKGRPRFDPLIVHVTDAAAARSLASSWPELAERLAGAFWPGPLTLVVPKAGAVPDLVTAGLPHVGLRVPDHPVAAALLTAAAERGVRGVAAPSANRFGRTSPTTAGHVREEFPLLGIEGPVAGPGGGVAGAVLDGGPCRTGVESTVVSLAGVEAGGRPTVLRRGGTPVEALRAVVGEVDVATRSTGGGSAARVMAGQASPGMLERHYAPRTPLTLVEPGGWSTWVPDSNTGALVFIGLPAGVGGDGGMGIGAVEVLSPSGDLSEAAANLFAAIRRLDERGLSRLYAEVVPEEGLGRAINDRLRRAAS